MTSRSVTSSSCCAGRFFFSSRSRHTIFGCDWSSDVCSSDLGYYAVAVALTNAIWLLPAALSGVLFPRIASLARDESVGKETMERAETKSLRHTSVQATEIGRASCRERV